MFFCSFIVEFFRETTDIMLSPEQTGAISSRLSVTTHAIAWTACRVFLRSSGKRFAFALLPEPGSFEPPLPLITAVDNRFYHSPSINQNRGSYVNLHTKWPYFLAHH